MYDVKFVDDVIGMEAEKAVSEVAPGSVIMLQNLRYEPGEEECSRDMSKRLASYSDIYVDDAFGNAHRKHASQLA